MSDTTDLNQPETRPTAAPLEPLVGRAFCLPAQEPFTHAYCENCKAEQQIRLGPLQMVSVDRRFRGNDIVCNLCHSVIATVSVQMDDETSSTHVCSDMDQLGGVDHVSSGAKATFVSS